MNCRCDEELAHTLADLAPTVFNDEIHNFHDQTACKTSISSGGNGEGNNVGNNDNDNQLKCCGTYPNRFEFRTQGGSRSCCSEVTYNPYQHDCCNGSLKDFGTCVNGQ